MMELKMIFKVNIVSIFKYKIIWKLIDILFLVELSQRK